MTTFAPAPPASLGRLSLQLLYLQRIQRLIHLHKHQTADLNKQGVRLVDKALFGAYCACRDAGVEGSARGMLKKANVGFRV